MAQVAIQMACKSNTVPHKSALKRWLDTALGENNAASEVTLRLVEKAEIRQLNKQYRQKDRSTNVLSFPAEVPPEFGLNLLGDIVICADVVEKEAEQQGKSLQAHWAHMLVHGALHLLGYDHIDDAEAEEMEALEIELLHSLGFANPYNS